MKRIRRGFAAICSAAMLLTSVGCADTDIISQEKQTEISFSWWGNDARNKYTIAAVKKFEELHPEIKVECKYSEWTGYEKRNKIWMISGTESDVMQINYGWLGTYSPDGEGYLDINTVSTKVDLTNFTSEQLSYGNMNGKLNAVPIAMNAQTVYINQTLYNRYSLDVPETWEDLIAAAEKMSEDNIYPLSAASKSMWLYLISYAEQKQGKSFLTDDGKLNFTANDFSVMIEFYQQLIDAKVMPQVEYYERNNLASEVYAGAVAWVSDAENYFGEAIKNGRNIVVAPYTTLEGHTEGEGWYGKPATMYAISKNTSHPEESAMLLDFLLNSSEMAEKQGIEKGIPLSKAAQSTIEKKGMLEGIQYEASQRMETAGVGKLNPVLETGNMIDDFFSASNDVIYEKATLSEASAELYKKLTADYF